MKNRFFVVVLMLAGMAIGFAACGGKNDPPPSETPSNAALITGFTVQGVAWNVATTGNPRIIKPNAAYQAKQDNLSGLVATVTFSAGASVSGVTNGSTASLNYENGTTHTFTVTAADGVTTTVYQATAIP